MNVLLVEDDDELAGAVSTGLRRERLAVDHAATMERAVGYLDVNPYDFVCLDLGLPDGDGLELCRMMHVGAVRRPGRIIMLTARDAVADRIAGLDAGADDYLVKPFSIAELAARIRALARRDHHGPGTVEIADVEIDLASHRVRRAGAEIDLTGREFAVLRYLASRRGDVVSAEQLLEHCWDSQANPFTDSARVILSRVRRKLGDPPLISTVRGVGYRFDEPT